MYEYHHMGIPTTEKRKGEKYQPEFKMWSSGYEDSKFRIEWHRFDGDCPLHPLIKTVPHVAFKVPDLKAAIKGKKVILEPYHPLEGFQVAFIEEGGAPIELIQTNLTEDEIIALAEKKVINIF